MFFGYMFVDVMSPLQALVEKQRGWTPGVFGTYASAEYILNVCGFLILAGIILDKMGVRFTGILSTSLMFCGAAIKYIGVSDWFQTTAFCNWLGTSFWTVMPGTQFYYNLFSSYIMAAIIEKTSGKGVMDYITPRLLEPLHITDMEWKNSPAGICVGGWGMKLCTEDVAKLGQLLLQHGKWNGCQLLPAEWVDTMTSRLVESSPRQAFIKFSDPAVLNDPENEHSQGYGYYVWQGKHGTYRLEGLGGQLVFVSAEKDVVLVFTSDSNMEQKYIDLIWKHFAHFF